MKVEDHIIEELLEKGLPAACLIDSDPLTLYLLSKRRPYIGKFVLELIHHIPIKGVFPSHFSLDTLEDDLLLVTIQFEKGDNALRSHLERLLYEIEWGASSPYHASRILEMKVLSMEEKKGLIQDHILRVIRRFPTFFDYDLFYEMQQFFLNVSDQYFRPRFVREVSETLIALYLMRKKVLQLHEKEGDRRHAAVKVMQRRLNLPLKQKEVLEITIAMNSLKENEVFKKSHLLKAVQNIIPEAKFIPLSDYLEKEGEDPLHLLTIEVEKEGGFEKEEISDLKRWLPRTLKGKVEHLQRSLFMPRNEEEILRHVITLGKELRFARDLPQVILSFEKQLDTHLVFTVILARILHPKMPPLEDVLMASSLRPKVDRIKQLGMLRKKYPKEAAVFKVELPISPFLREDHSIDLYKARQMILSRLQGVFGQIRDYNGGIISKQREVFQVLERIVGDGDRFLLENFFHSLFPLEKRSLIDPRVLKTLFLLLTEKMQSREPYLSKEENGVFFIIEEGCSLEKIQGVSAPLLTLDLEHDERQYTGFISLS